MGEKHSKEEKFTCRRYPIQEEGQKKYYSSNGGEVSPSSEKYKSISSYSNEIDKSNPETIYANDFSVQEDIYDESQNENQEIITNKQFGKFSQAIKIRAENIISWSKEMKNLFTHEISSCLSKFKLINTLFDSIEMEYIIIEKFSKRSFIDENNFILESNYFIELAIKKILREKDLLLFIINDPFFKIIPSISWSQLEKHLNDIMQIQKRTSDLDKFQADSNIENENYLDYAYNYYLESLNEISTLENEILHSYEAIMEKYNEMDKILSGIESISNKNYYRMKKCLRRIKDNLRDLMGINEQIEDAYIYVPIEFNQLTLAMSKAEDARMELKKYTKDIKSFCDSVMSFKYDRNDTKHENLISAKAPISACRAKKIIQNLYIMANLITSNLFLMDKNHKSFEKIKERVIKLNLTYLFEDIYTEEDAKIILIKYILETFITTNELLDLHVRESSITKVNDGEKNGGEEQHDHYKKMLSDIIIDANEIINHSISLLSEIEKDFEEINLEC